MALEHADKKDSRCVVPQFAGKISDANSTFSRRRSIARDGSTTRGIRLDSRLRDGKLLGG
ncbi:MAG: hypothetical protein ABSF67_03300 [Roseiarcus sp.]